MAKILIAEDDPLLVQLYKEAFQQMEYEVETAFNGEEAFDKLSVMKEKPTMVLSDIMMPKVNGLQLLEKIKASAELKNIPVVMLTNLGGEEDVKRALELGAVTYLVKSKYKPREVVEKVKEIIAAYTHDHKVPEVKVEIKNHKS